LGFVVLAFVLLNVTRWKPVIPPHRERLASLVAGSAAGLVGGATSVYGPPLTMFLIAAGVPKHKWATSVGVVFGLVRNAAGRRLPVINGLMTPQIIALSTLACIPAYIGMWIGMKLQNAMHPDTFRKVLMTALFLMALNLIRRGLV
jgi:uncharacterized membrane protein YfcA